MPSSRVQATPDTHTYVDLVALDGDRRLPLAQAGPDRLTFRKPPALRSGRIEIILTHGDQEQRHWAIVLPHDPQSVHVPIRLLPPHQF